MTDEIYRPPISLEREQREIDMMSIKPNDGGTGFGNRESEAFVDNILTAMGFGRNNQRIVNNLRAINILQNQTMPVVPTENMGYVFFTRPSLNLSYDNIATQRKMTPMLTGDKNSVWRFVRASLDHIGASSGKIGGDCPYVDPLNPFIPVLSNCIETLGGWPSSSVDSYTSKAGNYREQWSMIDSTYHILGSYSLNASFQNPPNDAISKLFNTWSMYGGLVYDGSLAAYPQARLQRYIDYNSRVYRFIMDHSKRKILKWAACGVCYPTFNNDAESMDFDRSKVYNEGTQRIDVSFMATGAEYNDPITLHEFNTAVEIMNPSMRSPHREQQMKRIEQHEKQYMNFLAYPYINLTTCELEWWTFANVHAAINSQLGDMVNGQYYRNTGSQ